MLTFKNFIIQISSLLYSLFLFFFLSSLSLSSEKKVSHPFFHLIYSLTSFSLIPFPASFYYIFIFLSLYSYFCFPPFLLFLSFKLSSYLRNFNPLPILFRYPFLRVEEGERMEERERKEERERERDSSHPHPMQFFTFLEMSHFFETISHSFNRNFSCNSFPFRFFFFLFFFLFIPPSFFFLLKLL